MTIKEGYANAEEASTAMDNAIGESDALFGGALTEDNAVEALMEKWHADEDEDGESPSEDEPKADAEEGAEAEQEEEPEEDAGETEDEAEEGAEDDDSDEGDAADAEDGEQDPVELADDVKVTVQVNGEAKEFDIGSLKRLAGQEAALTQKSQEVASMRTGYRDGMVAQRKALETMFERAQERFAPYKDMDFALAATQYDAETYQALRADAQSAFKDVSFFQEELGGMIENERAETAATLEADAVEAAKVLHDPVKGIKGFNAEMFGGMQKFAAENGLAPKLIETLVDPAAWKIVHMAMQYSAAKTTKAAAKPVKKSTKVVTTKKSTASAKAKKANKQARKVASSGWDTGVDSVDSAAAAFMSKWGVED